MQWTSTFSAVRGSETLFPYDFGEDLFVFAAVQFTLLLSTVCTQDVWHPVQLVKNIDRGFMQTLESPGIKMLTFPVLESPLKGI